MMVVEVVEAVLTLVGAAVGVEILVVQVVVRVPFVVELVAAIERVGVVVVVAAVHNLAVEGEPVLGVLSETKMTAV